MAETTGDRLQPGPETMQGVMQILWDNIDTSENLFTYLIAGHLTVLLTILLSRRRPNIQFFLLLCILSTILCSPYINEFLADRQTQISKHQYFDSQGPLAGFFLSMVLGVPFLCFGVLIIANLLWTTSNLLGDVKAAKSKAKERVAKEEKSEEEKKDE